MNADADFQEERATVLRLGRVDGREILDIGAGPLALMAVTHYDCYVTTIDTSPEKLTEAEEEAERLGVAEKISFELEDASDLSYPDDGFDIVICFCALHHIDEPGRESVIRELIRVSYERMVIAELNPSGFEELHSADPYIPVDLAWLEETLKPLGTFAVYPLDAMTIYVLEKRDQE
jgi:ubiquinone/menaquinone biosynthesis C-methylase UbiE